MTKRRWRAAIAACFWVNRVSRHGSDLLFYVAGAALADYRARFWGKRLQPCWSNPAVAALAKHTGVWDKRHDALFCSSGAFAHCWRSDLHWDKIAPLLP